MGIKCKISTLRIRINLMGVSSEPFFRTLNRIPKQHDQFASELTVSLLHKLSSKPVGNIKGACPA